MTFASLVFVCWDNGGFTPNNQLPFIYGSCVYTVADTNQDQSVFGTFLTLKFHCFFSGTKQRNSEISLLSPWLVAVQPCSCVRHGFDFDIRNKISLMLWLKYLVVGCLLYLIHWKQSASASLLTPSEGHLVQSDSNLQSSEKVTFLYLHFLRVLHEMRQGIISLLGQRDDDHVGLDRILLMTTMVIRIAMMTAAFVKRHMRQISDA